MKEELIILKSKGANFFGQESHGVAQIRGNGTLTLNEHRLHFKQWVTKKEIIVPIMDIKAIEKTKWHLKKSVGRNLLKITFINESSQLDSAAWFVRGLDKWISTLEKMIK